MAPEEVQQFRVGYFLRIEDDLYGFGMTRPPSGYLFVARVLLVSARVAGDHLDHAVELLEIRFDTPETSTGKGRRP